MDPSTSGAVLTGGRSTRFGSDKALAPVDGVAMAARVAAALRAAGVAEVLAVGGDGPALVEAGLPYVADPRQGEGPLAGVLGALEAAAHPLVVVVACDLPWLTPGTVRALVDALGPADVACGATDRRQPLLAAWRRDRALPVLAEAYAAGERSVHRAWAALEVVEVAVDAEAARDVDEPGDLHR